MESNIALKLKTLAYSKEVAPMINKFVADLSDDVVSLEELEQIVSYLASKGISIKKPSEQKVVANGFSFVQSQVENMERIGELGAYVEDPVRINSRGAIQRIAYLRSIDEPYKTPEGKYSKLPFRKRAFEAKYGVEYLNIASEELQNMQPVIEPTVVESERHKVTQVISPLATSKDGVVENVTSPNEFVNPLEEILSKPQTIGLNDETFERYERLADGIRQVMISVYGISEVNDTIIDNLIKLVTCEVEDDSIVMYYSITYGKSISPEETQRLRAAIGEALEYTSILEIDLGRAA